MTLQEFLRLEHRFGWSGHGFRSASYVENNCFTFPATWVEVVTGIDVAAPYRGKCSNQEEAAALIAREGGMVALAGRQLAVAGLRPTSAASHGDVGVVRTPDGHGGLPMIGAIKWGDADKPLWMVLGEVRALVKKAEVIAAWSLQC